jgi:hypothetical protein
MDDDRIFGVKCPETGRIDYCGVLGALGEVFALIAYEGAEGLNGYLKLLSGELQERSHVLEHQRCLMASFDDRSDLAPEDLEVIRSLELKFRGKNRWPMFRHYLPGYLPWFVTRPRREPWPHALSKPWMFYPDTGKTPLCSVIPSRAASS